LAEFRAVPVHQRAEGRPADFFVAVAGKENEDFDLLFQSEGQIAGGALAADDRRGLSLSNRVDDSF
jgi:hypothetical protein